MSYESILKGIEILITVSGWISYYFRKIKNWYEIKRPLSKLLGTLSIQNLYIAVPKLYSNENIKLKRPGGISETIMWPLSQALYAYSDAKSMVYLYNFLLSYGKKLDEIIIKSDYELSGEEKRENMLCIGAGSNSITCEALTTTRPPISFNYTPNMFGDFIKDYRSGESFQSNKEYDYALIIKMRNIRNVNKNMMIIAGLGPSGTEGAGYYFSNSWKIIYNRLKSENNIDKNFSAIIKVNENDKTDVELIRIRTW